MYVYRYTHQEYTGHMITRKHQYAHMCSLALQWYALLICNTSLTSGIHIVNVMNKSLPESVCWKNSIWLDKSTCIRLNTIKAAIRPDNCGQNHISEGWWTKQNYREYIEYTQKVVGIFPILYWIYIYIYIFFYIPLKPNIKDAGGSINRIYSQWEWYIPLMFDILHGCGLRE